MAGVVAVPGHYGALEVKLDFGGTVRSFPELSLWCTSGSFARGFAELPAETVPHVYTPVR